MPLWPDAQQPADGAGKTGRSLSKMLSNLDECSAEELQLLRQKQAQINSRFSSSEVAEGQHHLLNRAQGALTLKPEQLARQLEPQRLFEQFTEQALAPLRARQQLLLHNIEGARELRELYQWILFHELQAFLRPVHYRLGSRTTAPKSPDAPPSRRSALQNALIASAQGQPQACLGLVLSLELELNAVLTRVLLRDSRALFVLEWAQAPEFLLVAGFSCSYEESARLQGAQRTLQALQEQRLELSRRDLCDEEVDEAAPLEGSAETPQYDMGWLRRALRQAPLSYLYTAFVARD